jgi:phosphotransferase system IIB component
VKTEYIAIIVMVVIVGILLYYGFIHFIKNKTLKPENIESSFDIDLLVKALGGVGNIQDVSSSPSKLTVILADQSLIKVSSIQDLGASGIVEGKNTLSMIFGKQSPSIAEELKKVL